MNSRKSPRKPGYDYTTPGGYFITICTKNRKQYFGAIVNGVMVLNELGKICETYTKEIEKFRKNVQIHEYVIMPNHVHMIVVLGKRNIDWNDKNIVNHRRDVSIIRPDYSMKINNTIQINLNMVRDGFLNRPYGGPTVGNIIKLFKGKVTKYAKKQGIPFLWQSRYHDAIIRNQHAYDVIRWYIKNNPKNRKEDVFLSK